MLVTTIDNSSLQAINITSLIILVIQPANEGTYFVGWYMNYVGG